MNKYSNNGFSLIEVVVTVAIIGILSMIAYPWYGTYVAQTRRAEATIPLTALAAQQEKFFTQCGGYADTLGPNPPGRVCPAVQGGPGGIIDANTVELNPGGATRTGNYQIVMTPGPTGTLASSYAITASPIAGSPQFLTDNLRCTTIAINSTGAKSATGTESLTGPNGGGCWKK